MQTSSIEKGKNDHLGSLQLGGSRWRDQQYCHMFSFICCDSFFSPDNILNQNMLKSVIQTRFWLPRLTAVASTTSRCYNNERKPVLPRAKVEENVHNWSELDPDKFGNLASANRTQLKTITPLRSETSIPDDKDGYDKLEIKRGPKISLDGYYRMLNEILHRKPLNVREMIKLHRQFIYEDRYKPTKKFYTAVVTACARVGYTKKAIELFEEMKGFKLLPTQACVTSLLNACANCHPSEQAYGLEQTRYLREQFELLGYELNEVQYNVLIKAFARLNDQKAALETLEEMMSKGRKVDNVTFGMLLMGCINNKKEGMLEAIRVFQKLLETSADIDVYAFNLLLRATRDCEVGTPEQLKQLCAPPQQTKLKESKQSRKTKKIMPKEEKQSDVDIQLASVADSSQTTTSLLPNLLTGDNLDQIVAINFETLYKTNRIALLGGTDGVLKLMARHKVRPNLKTLTLLAELNNVIHWRQLVNLAAENKIKLDTCFFNVLLKNASKIRAVQEEIIAHMTSTSLQPDIMTFGALTFGCAKVGRAARLLKDMEQIGVKPNEPIMASLVNNACFTEDLEYIFYLLGYFQRKELELPTSSIEQIDVLLKKIETSIAKAQRRGNTNEITPELVESHTKVLNLFKSMMKSQKVVVGEHPWAQFEDDDVKPVKGKDEFHAIVRMMKKKMDIKQGKSEQKEIIDYNDEIDD